MAAQLMQIVITQQEIIQSTPVALPTNYTAEEIGLLLLILKKDLNIEIKFNLQ